MKILQVNKFFYPKGGSESYMFALSELLKANGHEVVHFSMKHAKNVDSPYAEYFVEEVDFQNRSGGFKKAKQFIWSSEAERKFAQLLADTKPDVIHVHNIAHQLTPSILKPARMAGIPVVQTLHDYQLICPSYNLFTNGAPCQRCNSHKYLNAVRFKCVQDSTAASTLSAVEMGYHNILKQSYKKGVARFIAPSQFMHDTVASWGWSETQLAYIPHFVEQPAVEAATTKNQFLFVGRLIQEKGIDVLLDAAAELQKQNCDAKIVFAGTGPLLEEAQNRVQAESLSNVEFAGFVPKEQLMPMIAESLAVVVPSTWYENAPMTIYESLALGTPVIGTNAGGIPELIKEGTSGYLFEMGDSAGLAKNMKMLYDSASTSEASIDEKQAISQPFLSQYSAQKHLESIEALYAEVSEQNTE